MATTTQQPHPQAAFNQMIMGSWVTQAIYVAAELGIADIVKSGAQTAAEIAKQVDAHGDALQRILRALASVGVFRENVSGQFEQTRFRSACEATCPDRSGRGRVCKAPA